MLTLELVRLTLAVSLLAGGAAAGVAAYQEIHQASVHTLAAVQRSNADQLMQAARTAYFLEYGHPAPDVAALIAAGYLLPEYVQREAVSTEPLVLPEPPPEVPGEQ